jgi:hypothetical protein
MSNEKAIEQMLVNVVGSTVGVVAIVLAQELKKFVDSEDISAGLADSIYEAVRDGAAQAVTEALMGPKPLVGPTGDVLN